MMYKKVLSDIKNVITHIHDPIFSSKEKIFALKLTSNLKILIEIQNVFF